MPGEGSCSTDGKVVVTVAFTTKSGKPATVDGPITASVLSGDGSVGTVNDLDFEAITGDTATDTVFEITADADLGAGVQSISDTYTLHATSPQAASFGFSTSPETPK